LTVSRTLGYSRSQHCHRGLDLAASHQIVIFVLTAPRLHP
jgi:hypothetical protein